MTTPALRVERVSFAYGAKPVLREVSFSVAAGECAILLGPNGAGKSTLFALITRLYDTPTGTIEIGGFALKKASRRALARIGVVFQQSTLDLDLTIMQNLRYHAALYGLARKTARARIQEELERFALFDRRNEKVRQLNGGHRRRVEIARALLHSPSLLLLDEPTVGLDIASRHALVEHLQQRTRHGELAVLWATHLLDEIAEDNHLIILHLGQVRADGVKGALLHAAGCDSLQKLFFQYTEEKSIS